MLIAISKIRINGGTQPRATIDFSAVEDYSDAMRDGVKFPAVTVFYDGSEYWLADGFHRREAAFAADLDVIECDVRQGTQQDAQWYSFSANKTNGLRRTNEDKQRAVKAALAHARASGLSDNQISKHVGVAQSTVSEWRKRVNPSCDRTSPILNRVLVAGEIFSNAKGEPVKVAVSKVALIEGTGHLPTVAELTGSDPDFTGGLSTEEYIRSIRRG